MCCFSAATPVGWIARLISALTPPVHVSATNIFARMVAPGEQVLAYSMTLATKEPVAMILPLPVPAGSGEDAVTFISLEKHATLFEQLRDLFDFTPAPRKGGMSLSVGRQEQRLIVHRVGSFIASYVPTRADFARLDPRFRIPEVLFDAVPAYVDYGFAVFQLTVGKTTIHPMAMRFPTRAPDTLFFPTVHVHDGRFTAKARFDHALYFQTKRHTELGGTFENATVSEVSPAQTYDGLLAWRDAVLRRTLRGRLPNTDTWIAA